MNKYYLTTYANAKEVSEQNCEVCETEKVTYIMESKEYKEKVEDYYTLTCTDCAFGLFEAGTHQTHKSICQ